MRVDTRTFGSLRARAIRATRKVGALARKVPTEAYRGDPPEGWPSYPIKGNQCQIAPASAWLLKGSEDSYLDPAELRRCRAEAEAGIYTCDWTTAAQTRVGDLALFYFLSPRKAVHFIARAASDAFFSRDVALSTDGSVSNAQWWAYFTPPIEIEPIPVKMLRQAAGGYLPLHGRSGLYLRPETIAALLFRAVDPASQEELERVVVVPVGLPNLPDPTTITHNVWRELAAGALPLEEYVSSHIVEPLLRDLLADTGLTWQAQFRIENRVADFVILSNSSPVHVIEVKKVIKQSPHGWGASPDFAQVRWYADRLGVPSTLIDSHRVVLIQRGGTSPVETSPVEEIERRTSTREDLDRIRSHLLSGSARNGPCQDRRRRAGG